VTKQPGEQMAAEIAEQPEMLAGVLAAAAGGPLAVGAQIRRARPRFVVVAARGTSDHAALYAKYLAEIRMSLPAGLASPSSLTLYGARPDLSNVLFLAVSQSGGSPDLIDSVTAARECGALTVAVTNAPQSDLASAAELHVDVLAGTELAVAATKTYTAELLSLYLLLAGPDAAAAAAALPDAAAATLELADTRVADAAAHYRYTSRVVTTARGYSYPTAREAALKLMETSYISAQAFSGADLLHGPLAMIDADVPVIAVTSAGRGGSAMIPVVQRLRESGADVLEVGSAGGTAARAPGLAIADAGLAEELLPVVEILPLQRLAWQLAVNRGEDPDRPRGLSKVTRTW
jgi:glucosamine--fructose-6-phosphate aminotransferase (isomerizing)